MTWPCGLSSKSSMRITVDGSYRATQIYYSAVLGEVILSVCLSRACFVTKQSATDIPHERASILSF